MDQTYYIVELASVGSNVLAVIKNYRDMSGIGLKDAKDKIDAAPSVILKTSVLEEAQHYKAVLESFGAVVNIYSESDKNMPKKYAYANRLKKVSLGFLMLNIAAAAVLGAAVALIPYYLKHGFFMVFFSVNIVVFFEFIILSCYYGNRIVDGIVRKTIRKSSEKLDINTAFLFHYNNLTVIIDVDKGLIAYVSNMNPWKFQLIPAEDIIDISVGCRRDLILRGMTNFVYFQFSYRGRVIKTPVFAVKYPVPIDRLQDRFDTAQKFSVLLKAAKDVAVCRGIRKL